MYFIILLFFIALYCIKVIIIFMYLILLILFLYYIYKIIVLRVLYNIFITVSGKKVVYFVFLVLSIWSSPCGRCGRRTQYIQTLSVGRGPSEQPGWRVEG